VLRHAGLAFANLRDTDFAGTDLTDDNLNSSDLTGANLVYGLTPRPDEGPCPWYEKPPLWATVVTVVLVAINVLFW
jgi:hypothetical protein